MTNWCKTCQLEHSSGHCPVVASTVEQIEGYQQHLERKFWEQCFIRLVATDWIEDDLHAAAFANLCLDRWRERWGKK